MDVIRCPVCGSDEVYYERFAPEHPRGVWACQECGEILKKGEDPPTKEERVIDI